MDEAYAEEWEDWEEDKLEYISEEDKDVWEEEDNKDRRFSEYQDA